MGRHKGFVAMMFSDMEKAHQRALAEQRRTQRMVQNVQMRAVEREMKREERAEERERVRLEREAERRRMENQKEHAAYTKQAEKRAAKDAQLRAWTLECEACQEREADIDRIANDGPEVEERDQMYAAITARRVFEAKAFIAPPAHRSDDEANAIKMHAASEFDTAMAAFRPDLLTLRKVQFSSGIIGVLGLVLVLCSIPNVGAPAILIGFAGVAVVHMWAQSSSQRQRRIAGEKSQERLDDWVRQEREALEQRDAFLSATILQNAQAEYRMQLDYERREFEAAEDERLRGLRELQAGDGYRMKDVLEEALDLELPVPCPALFTIESANEVTIELTLPPPNCLPAQEAKQQASGKVVYKPKPEKRLREQYLRLIAGVSLRYASEAMLYLPSCDRVHVRAILTDINPATGTAEPRCVLDVVFDYATLAPMTMDGIDPVAALEHFQHQLALSRGRELQRARA